MKIKAQAIAIYDFFLNLYILFFLALFISDFSFLFSALQRNFSISVKDISNISTQVPGLIILLLIRWFLDKTNFANAGFIKLIKRIGRFGDRKILFFIFFIFILIFASIGIARHMAFSSSGCDLAVSDQAIWNTMKGNILFCSLDGNINHLGAHFDPVLFLIVPLYAIWPNVIILILLQAIALGLAIFPLYLIAKNQLNSRILVFAFIFAYFISRSVRGIGLLDFHTDSFLVPLSFWAFYFLIKGRIIQFLVSLFVMLLCKENAAFLIAGFGIFCFFQKKYRLGALLLLFGIAAWFILTGWVMPYFANTKDYPYLCWLPFGSTYSQNLTAVLKNPALLKGLFLSPGKINFYFKLFGPLGFLSFLSPKHCILFLVPLTVQVVASVGHPGMETISSHYPAHTMPFIFISAIYGAGWLIERMSKNKENRHKKITYFLAGYITLTSLLFYGKTDGHKFAKFIKGAKDIHSLQVISSLNMIPKDASVCAVNNLVPHLSHRKYIYMWKGLKSCKYITEFIVLHKDLLDPVYNGSIADIVTALECKGYKKVFFDQYGSLYIFFNPNFDKSILEKQSQKLIPIENIQ